MFESRRRWRFAIGPILRCGPWNRQRSLCGPTPKKTASRQTERVSQGVLLVISTAPTHTFPSVPCTGLTRWSTVSVHPIPPPVIPRPSQYQTWRRPRHRYSIPCRRERESLFLWFPSSYWACKCCYTSCVVRRSFHASGGSRLGVQPGPDTLPCCVHDMEIVGNIWQI